MRVTSVEAIPVSIPFVVPFAVWRGDIATADRVIVRVSTDEGITGYGESAVFPFYSEENHLESLVTIKEDFAPMITGADPFELERLAKLMDVVIGHHCTKAAIETALWDIIGKKLSIPVYSLIGGRYYDKLPVVGLLTLGKPEHLTEESRHYKNMGYKTIKIKGGLGIETDVKNFIATREAIGPNVKLRIDVEENYTPKAAIKMIRAIEPYEPELVSQPVSRFDIDGMSLVRKSVSTTILADECIFGPEDAMTVVKREAADMINIKVMKNGGIMNAKKIAHIAEMAGLPCVVGSMIEMGPGTYASVQFMTATRVAGSYACELVGPRKMKDDVTKEPVKFEDGYLIPPKRPGLGFEIDEARLQKFRTG